MAKRRSVGQGALAGVQSMIDLLLQQKIRSDAATKQADYQESLDRESARMQADLTRETNARNQSAQLRNQTMGDLSKAPQIADRLVEGGMTEFGGMNIAPFQSSQRERVSPLLEDVGASKTLSELDTPNVLAARARAAGVNADPRMGGPNLNFPSMDIPGLGRREIPAFPIRPEGESRTPIEELIRAQQSQQTNLTEQKSAEQRMTPHLIPGEGGAPVMGVEGLGGPMFTERTGEQEGQRELAQFEAGEGSPAYAAAQADFDNQMSRLTRGEKARDAASIAAATRSATLNVDKAMGAGDFKPEQGPMSNLRGPLLYDLANAISHEAQGATLPAFATTLSEAPTLQSIAQFTKLARPEQINYLNAATTWAANITRVYSGAQSRENEFGRFLTAFFHTGADDTMGKQLKAQRRAAFMTSMAVAGGGNVREGGRVLGKAIREGLISPDVLAQMNFEPEFAQGVLETSGIPAGAR